MDRNAAYYDRYHSGAYNSEEDEEDNHFESYVDGSGNIIITDFESRESWGPYRKSYYETKDQIAEVYRALHKSQEEELTQHQHSVREKAFQNEIRRLSKLLETAAKQYSASTEWRLIRATCGGHEKIFTIHPSQMKTEFSRWIESETGYKVGGTDGWFVQYIIDTGESGKILI